MIFYSSFVLWFKCFNYKAKKKNLFYLKSFITPLHSPAMRAYLLSLSLLLWDKRDLSNETNTLTFKVQHEFLKYIPVIQIINCRLFPIQSYQNHIHPYLLNLYIVLWSDLLITLARCWHPKEFTDQSLTTRIKCDQTFLSKVKIANSRRFGWDPSYITPRACWTRFGARESKRFGTVEQ